MIRFWSAKNKICVSNILLTRDRSIPLIWCTMWVRWVSHHCCEIIIKTDTPLYIPRIRYLFFYLKNFRSKFSLMKRSCCLRWPRFAQAFDVRLRALACIFDACFCMYFLNALFGWSLTFFVCLNILFSLCNGKISVDIFLFVLI